MNKIPLNINSDTWNMYILSSWREKQKYSTTYNTFNISSVFILLSNPQVYAADGKCTEYRSVWPLSDYAGHNMLRCFFCSYGTV